MPLLFVYLVLYCVPEDSVIQFRCPNLFISDRNKYFIRGDVFSITGLYDVVDYDNSCKLWCSGIWT